MKLFQTTVFLARRLLLGLTAACTIANMHCQRILLPKLRRRQAACANTLKQLMH